MYSRVTTATSNVHYCQAYNLLESTCVTDLSRIYEPRMCVTTRAELTRATVIHVRKTQIWNRHFCGLNKLRGTQRYLRAIMRLVNMKAS